MATNQQVNDGDKWAADLVKRVGAEAKRLRGRKSAQWLSDETEALGYRISPQVIARLDSNRRAGHLEVAELVILAKALGVAPVQLLYPDLPFGLVDAIPGRAMYSITAISRFIGDDWYGPDEPHDQQSADLLAASKELFSSMSFASDMEVDLAAIPAEIQQLKRSRAKGPAAEAQITALEDSLNSTHQVLARLNQEIAELHDEIEKIRKEQGR